MVICGKERGGLGQGHGPERWGGGGGGHQEEHPCHPVPGPVTLCQHLCLPGTTVIETHISAERDRITRISTPLLFQFRPLIYRLKNNFAD